MCYSHFRSIIFFFVFFSHDVIFSLFLEFSSFLADDACLFSPFPTIKSCFLVFVVLSDMPSFLYISIPLLCYCFLADYAIFILSPSATFGSVFLFCMQTMPICALIATTSGRIFACHGGISPDVSPR